MGIGADSVSAVSERWAKPEKNSNFPAKILVLRPPWRHLALTSPTLWHDQGKDGNLSNQVGLGVERFVAHETIVQGGINGTIQHQRSIRIDRYPPQ